MKFSQEISLSILWKIPIGEENNQRALLPQTITPLKIILFLKINYHQDSEMVMKILTLMDNLP